MEVDRNENFKINFRYWFSFSICFDVYICICERILIRFYVEDKKCCSRMVIKYRLWIWFYAVYKYVRICCKSVGFFG